MVLMCITRSVQQGAARAAFAGAGSVTAVLCVMAASAAGLGALLQTSEAVFQALKWAGALYLMWLGWNGLRSGARDFEMPAADGTAPSGAGASASATTTPAATKTPTQLDLQRLLVGASNPKALLFFTAFFPQFLDPSLPELPQFLIMAATFVVCEALSLAMYSLGAAQVGPWLRRPGRARVFNRVTGGLFRGAGLLLASAHRAVRAS